MSLGFSLKVDFGLNFLIVLHKGPLKNIRFGGLPEHFTIVLRKGPLKRKVWGGPPPQSVKDLPKSYVLKGPYVKQY